MQGGATTKANHVDFFYIETAADFTACMEAVGGLGFSTMLTSTVGEGQPLAWVLTMNGPTQSGLVAGIGQVVVWDGRQLTIFPNADAFLALHNIN